jgi:hypothetical protein
MNTTEEENQIPDMVDQNIDKFLNALLIVFHEIGAEPAEGEQLFAESSLALDDQGFFRYILPNHFLYTLSEEQVKAGGFGESDSNVVIPIVDDRYFVLVQS